MKNNQVRRLLCVLAFILFLSPLPVFAADDLRSAFSEGAVSGSWRTYYWTRDFDNQPDEEDGKTFVTGGFLSYETAPLKGLTAGVGFRTAQNIDDDDDFGEYFGLMPEGNEPSVTGLSEAYVRYNGFDTMVTLGRQYIDTPYLNPHDQRLMPKCFKGISIVNNSLRNFEFNAGLVNEWMDWTADRYMGMTTSVLEENGVSTDGVEDENNYYVGVSYKPVRGMDANLWYYKFTDLYDLITAQFKYFKVFGRDWKGFIDLRATTWSETGDKLIGEVDTDMIGFIAGIFYKDLSLILFGQQNGDQELQELFAHRRAVTSLIGRAYRAEETAYSAKLNYDFTGLGLSGLSAYIRYTVYDTPDPGEDNFTQDYTESEAAVLYDFDGSLEGLSVWLRYAMADKDEDQEEFYPPFLQKLNEDISDVRLYIKYDF